MSLWGVCVCVRETERERGRGIFGISSVKRMWKVRILRKKIEESKGWLSSRPWSKSRGVCPPKTVYFRPTTTRHSILLSFLIFATFMCLSKLIRTYKNWNLAWTRLISLPLIAPKEFKSISWLWADLCSCSRFPTLCHRPGGLTRTRRGPGEPGCPQHSGESGRIPDGVLGPSIWKWFWPHQPFLNSISAFERD